MSNRIDVRDAAARLPDESDEPEESGAAEIPAEGNLEGAEDLSDATTEVTAEVVE